MHHLSRLAVAICLFSLASCINTAVRKGAAFDLAMSMEQTGSGNVYTANSPDISKERAASPYVAVVAYGGYGIPDANFLSAATKKIAAFSPDFVIAKAPDLKDAGTIYSFSGGLGMSSRVYQKQRALFAYRYQAARIGIRWSEDGMVTAITNQGLYDAGLLEGDTMISIDGIPFPKSQDAQDAWHAHTLGWKPGDEIELIWIRPGEGRMQGTIPLLINN